MCVITRPKPYSTVLFPAREPSGRDQTVGEETKPTAAVGGLETH